jgi:hypothetical protein
MSLLGASARGRRVSLNERDHAPRYEEGEGPQPSRGRASRRGGATGAQGVVDRAPITLLALVENRVRTHVYVT